MATKVNVNGKIVSRPGVYTLVKSGIKNAPANLAFGNVAIIDDGIGAGYGGGVGGTAYTFQTVQDFQSFVKGGELWNIGEPLFKPLPGFIGVSKLFLIQARETTPATITYAFSKGDVVLTTKDEGLNANGVVDDDSVLRKGYAATFIAGKTANKYILQLWHGTYKELDPLNNTPYDGVTEPNAAPLKIAESIEVSDLFELRTWLEASSEVTDGFEVEVTIDDESDAGDGDLVAGDVSGNTGYKLAVGGTETYSSNAFDDAVTAAKALDCNFFLSTKYGSDAEDAHNDDLVDMILGGKYERFLVIGGGADKSEYTSVSKSAALHFNTDKAIVVHGNGKKTIKKGYKIVSTFWKAAEVLGRLCGLEPQTPITYKQIAIDAEVHVLDEDEQEASLDDGVLVSIYDDELGYVVVLQGVNTLQENDNLVNEDASSSDIAVKRITAQLNKEVAVHLKRKFFGKPSTGPNRNTITEDDINAAVEGFLQSKVASTLTDNLILRFGNISTSVSQDIYRVSYEFVPNFPVDKIIVTGIILER